MHELNLSESDYNKVREASESNGFETPEAYIMQLVKSDLEAQTYEDFFTPEILAEIDAAAAKARTGNNLTFDEVMAQIRKKAETWQRDRSA